MSALRRFLIPALLCLSLETISCGGGSAGGTKISAEAPVFSTAPPTAAAQGSAYSYQVEATDPSGGTVSFALTTGPTGATMSGSMVSWTPTAAQSRTANNFTITATTSENATATQTWTVSPTGVVTVNWINNYWEASGVVQVPVTSTASLQLSVVVPNPDGSFTVLKGNTAAPGVITIAGVPSGNYWLTLGPLSLLPQFSSSASAFWTNATTIDAGRDYAGYPEATNNATNDTAFAFNLSGLDSVNSFTPVLFNTEMQAITANLIDPLNTTTLSQSIGITSEFDWSQVKTAFLTQYEPATLGQFSEAVAGASVMLTNPSFTDGATNNITQVLQNTSPVSLDVTVQGTQFASTFTGASTSAPTTYYAQLGVAVEPFVSAVNAQVPSGNLALAATSYTPPALNFAVASFNSCTPSGFSFTNAAIVGPGIKTDVDLGTLQYNDPYSSKWTRAEIFCEEAVVPVAIPNSTATENFALVTSATTAPSSSAIAPLIGPVLSPTINNADLFTAATISTSTPTLAWTAPLAGTPYGYRVSVYILNNASSTAEYASAGVFSTSQTSMTLPPLSTGNTYVFAITSLMDGATNIQTSPFRSALPTGSASVVSAPITISSSAAQAQIHGDARVIKQFSQPAAPRLRDPQHSSSSRSEPSSR